jgi:hypothetical protein
VSTSAHILDVVIIIVGGLLGALFSDWRWARKRKKLQAARLRLVQAEVGCGMVCDGGSEKRRCACRNPAACTFAPSRPITEEVE